VEVESLRTLSDVLSRVVSSVLGGIILAAVLLVRWIGGGPAGTPSTGKSQADILNERFARGEIDKKEFEGRDKLPSH
jgi:putative membrane protein